MLKRLIHQPAPTPVDVVPVDGDINLARAINMTTPAAGGSIDAKDIYEMTYRKTCHVQEPKS